MRKILVLAVAATVLAGCADLKVPVTGQMAGGPAAGQAIARWSGKGDFWVQAPAGLKCSGEYDPFDTNPTIVVPIKCTNGKTGEIVITRQLDGLSGTAIAKLSDGTEGQFVFGNLKFDQAFGSGTASTAGTVVVR